jgi:P27 family predicted phage terminase small subunit
VRGRKPAALDPERAPLVAAPNPPAWLSRHAKAEWRRIMPILVERRILTDADMASVENFCLAIGRTRELESLIQKAGDAIDPKLFRLQDKAIQTARQLAAELGLTPVSRSRPSMRDEETNDDLAGLDI